MKLTNHAATLLLSLGVALCSQCSDDDSDSVVVPDPAGPDHTLLVYIAGENSLSGYADPNIRSIEAGLRAAAEEMNVVIFKDIKESPVPELFCLRRVGDDIDTTVVATFAEAVDATDPAVMREVVAKTFSDYDTDIKGMLLWSHAMSWIPSAEFQIPAAEASSRSEIQGSGAHGAPAYWGQDGTHYMELWELREALAAGPHLDYLVADACHFATAEVAYELDSVADYLLASPTEIMGNGFPYARTIPALAAATPGTIEDALLAAAATFAAEYYDNGTITLIHTGGVEALARSVAAARRAAPAVVADMEMHPAAWHNRLQHYGRRRTGALYYYYDVAELSEQYAAADTARFAALLDDVILYEHHSTNFTDGAENLSIARCCGLAVSVPELFSLSSNSAKLTAAYPMTKWGALMMAAEE